MALLVVGAAAASRAEADDGLFGSPFRFTESTGADIYRSVCAGCHMADGQGAEGAGAYPTLVRDTRLAPPDYPIHIILHGRAGMPPFARTLSDGQVAAVVDYIRNNFGNAYADKTSEAEVRSAR